MQLGCIYIIRIFAAMIKKLGNISLFVLWFAGLLIISHAVIPHDHHSDYSSDHHNKTEKSNSGHFVHCSFLNSIIVENTVSVKNKVSENKKTPDTDNSEKFNCPVCVNTEFEIFFSYKKNFTKQVFYKENIPTRGSPVLI